MSCTANRQTLSVRQALFWTWSGSASRCRSRPRSTACTSIAGSASTPGPGGRDGHRCGRAVRHRLLLEWSLSVDNIFVIAVIFTYLKIPAQYQYRVLFWGIVGAIVLRGLMIAAGTALIHDFDWMFYVFGAILLLSGAAHARRARRRVRSSAKLPGAAGAAVRTGHARARWRALLRARGRQAVATPLFVALLHGRLHRRRVRGRLDPGDPRRHAGSVPGLHVERLRDPGPALALFRHRRA